MVDLSKTEAHAVETSSPGSVELQADTHMGNGQGNHPAAADPAAISADRDSYTGASIRVSRESA